MKTTTLSTPKENLSVTAHLTFKNLYQDLLKEYNSKALGYASMGIICSSCIGAIAVMLIQMNDHLPKTIQILELTLITILCMLFNGTVLSQQPSKIQLNTLIASIFGSFILIDLNF